MQNLLEKLGLGERATSMVVWIGLSVLLLVIVIALAVWLVRTLRPSLNMSGGQARGGRPQRLAITDAFNLDREGRRLVIVRRDNVEHLLLIGGPNDVVVESAIVRGERIARDRGGRIISENDAAFAAETALTTELTRAEQPVPAPVAPPAPPAPPAPLVRPAPPAPSLQMRAPTPQPAPPPPPAPRLDDDFERAFAAMPVPAPRPAPQQPAPPPMPPRAAPPPPPMQPVAPPVVDAPQPAPMAPPPPPAPPAPPRQEPVSEMARRLNEVLQKPLSGTLRAPFNKPIPPVPATMNSAPRPPEPASPPPPVQQAAPPPQPAPAPAAPPALPPMPEPPAPGAKPASTELEMDLLEEEMARLLGRPAQPTKPGAS